MYASLHTNRKADCPHKPYTVYVLIIEGELRTGSRGGFSAGRLAQAELNSYQYFFTDRNLRKLNDTPMWLMNGT
ncbi:unnamed protein product [Ixodes hexagonus]